MQVNYYKSIWAAYINPSDIVTCSFTEWVSDTINSSTELTDKGDGMLYNLCSFIDDYESPDGDETGLIRRCKSNVKELYALLLDIDGTMTLEQSLDVWSEYEFFAYSTFSNSLRKEKFRFVIPLKIPMTIKQFDERHDSMCDKFNVDHASFTISQAFYLPCFSSENKDIAWTHYNDTENRYDALNLPTKVISYNVCEKPVVVTDGRSLSMYNTLITGRGLRYADALSVAMVCKSFGLGESEFRYIVSTIGAPDSSVRNGVADLRKIWKDAYASHLRTQTIITLLRKLNCQMWRYAQ